LFGIVKHRGLESGIFKEENKEPKHIVLLSVFFFGSGRMRQRRSQKSYTTTVLTGFVNQRIMWMITEDVEDEIEGFIYASPLVVLRRWAPRHGVCQDSETME
jgi:hypothetical protein